MQKELNNFLNGLLLKKEIDQTDLAFINSPNAETLVIYLKESYILTTRLFEKLDILNKYLIVKIEKLIDAEYTYSNIKNSGGRELAIKDISTEIEQDLQKIENLLKRNELLIEEDYILEYDLEYDLDYNFLIESKS